MHVDLEEAPAGNPELTIDCHRDCVSTYTPKLHLSRQTKRQSNANDLRTASQPSKRHCRSQVPTFKLKENCLFCGDLCELEKDKKHPCRWKRAVLCRTANAGPAAQSLLPLTPHKSKKMLTKHFKIYLKRWRMISHVCGIQLSYMLNTSSTVGKNFLEGRPFLCVFKTTS